MGSGLITLAEIVAEAVDNDTDFSGTEYVYPPMPQIVRAAVTSITRSVRLRTPETPNLMRKIVIVSYHRVRLTVGRPYYRELLVGLHQKLMNNPRIENEFRNRISFVDDPDDPSIEAPTVSKPCLGIHDGDYGADFLFAEKREEILQAELIIYAQRFTKTMNERIIGV